MSDTAAAKAQAVTSPVCYRSPTSVMARTTPFEGHSSVAPGWLRFETSSGRDSGTLRLVDADGAALHATWRRSTADSLEIRGFDDFMRVEMRVMRSDSALAGTGLLTSDADVQRNAAGKLETLRREWAVRAVAAPCSGVPAVTG